jgi:hypothetical protein
LSTLFLQFFVFYILAYETENRTNPQCTLKNVPEKKMHS